jgi:hypothetical protein
MNVRSKMPCYLIAAWIVLVSALIVTSIPDVKKRTRPVRLRSQNSLAEFTITLPATNPVHGTR